MKTFPRVTEAILPNWDAVPDSEIRQDIRDTEGEIRFWLAREGEASGEVALRREFIGFLNEILDLRASLR